MENFFSISESNVSLDQSFRLPVPGTEYLGTEGRLY
jgi:hypothetical protein